MECAPWGGGREGVGRGYGRLKDFVGWREHAGGSGLWGVGWAGAGETKECGPEQMGMWGFVPGRVGCEWSRNCDVGSKRFGWEVVSIQSIWRRCYTSVI